MTEMTESVNPVDPETASVIDYLVPPPRSQRFAFGVAAGIVVLAIGFVIVWFGGTFSPHLSTVGGGNATMEHMERAYRPATAFLVVHNDGWFDAVVVGATDTAGTSMSVGDERGETGRISLPAGESTKVAIRYTVDCSGATGRTTGGWLDHTFVLQARSVTFPVTMHIVIDANVPFFDDSWC